MRIGIDYRMLSGGTGTVHRGMGRYTQQQLREVLRFDTGNEYVLFCLPGADPSLILPEIRENRQVSVAAVELDRSDFSHENRAGVLRYAEEYLDWVYRQRIDLYHATTPFLWSDVVLSRFDVCPVVATFYDAIPLVFPSQYLADWPGGPELYLRSASLCRTATRLIAISQSAQRDALLYLGYPKEQVDVAYPIADPCFRPLPEVEREARMSALQRRLALPSRYVLSVTHLHHSKNFETLVTAYSLLPKAVRAAMPLVIAAHFESGELDQIRDATERLGITESVLPTGLVSDDELVTLYNSAVMLVHPSRYEGFGLPVLEAMKCGTPVITTTAAALPEVGGSAAVLFEPDDTRGMAAAIEELYCDSQRRQAMSQAGLVHAEKFSPAQLGRTTLESYRKAVDGKSQQAAKPRLALWTPLPPQKSGVADYSAELLKGLVRDFDVEVFVDDGYLPSTDLLDRYVIQHHRAFERRHSQAPFAAIIYQLGGSSFHFYIYPALQKWPGLVVLHDLTWGHAIYGKLMGCGRVDEFKEELRETEGPAAVQEFERLLLLPGDSFASAVEPFLRRHCMLPKVVGNSQAIIVHSESHAAEVKASYPSARAYTIPMGVEDPWAGWPVLETAPIRKRFGLRPESFVVGVFGILAPIKRVHLAIQAFRWLLTDFPDARFLAVGDQADPDYDRQLRKLIKDPDLGGTVILTGHTDRRVFDDLMLACDAVVSLRYPSNKQVSAVVIRTLAAGKPQVITDLPEWNFIPSDCCYRVKPGDGEVAAIADCLRTLAENPALRQSMSIQSRRWYEEQHSLWKMAARYREVVEDVRGLATADRQARPESFAADHQIRFNKVCEAEDLKHPELAAALRDIARDEVTPVGATQSGGPWQGRPHGVAPTLLDSCNSPVSWVQAMSVRALERLGALRAESRVLCVGQSTDPAFVSVMEHIRRESGRLVAGRIHRGVLLYPDASFDAIFSSGVIERLEDLKTAANAAYEMGRVLKPGGLLVLSTRFLLAGPPGPAGFRGSLLFSHRTLMRYIVEASGLELVDELKSEVSTETLTSRRELNGAFQQEDNTGQARSGDQSLLSVRQGYVFCPVQLALRRTDRYPAGNSWAQPDEAVRQRLHKNPPDSADEPSAFPTPGIPTRSYSGEAIEALRSILRDMESIRLKGWRNRTLARLPGPVSALVRLVVRVLYLGHFQEAEAKVSSGAVRCMEELRGELDEINRRSIRISGQIEDLSAQVRLLRNELARPSDSEPDPSEPDGRRGNGHSS